MERPGAPPRRVLLGWSPECESAAAMGRDAVIQHRGGGDGPKEPTWWGEPAVWASRWVTMAPLTANWR
eukprot:748391-Pyramimonas_sp.AAC.1